MNKKFLEILNSVNETIKKLGFKNINDAFSSQNTETICKELEILQKNKQKEIDELEKKIKNGMNKTELENIIDKIQKIERYVGTLEGACIALETNRILFLKQLNKEEN